MTDHLMVSAGVTSALLIFKDVRSHGYTQDQNSYTNEVMVSNWRRQWTPVTPELQVCCQSLWIGVH